MKSNALLVIVWAGLWALVNAFAPPLNVTIPPTCALTCIISEVPKFCKTIANLTCVCTDPYLSVALANCSLNACNVTDSLRLENYRDQTCGIKNDKRHQNQDMRLHLVLTPLVFLFIAARFYIRVQMNDVGLDDWSMVAAGFFYMVSAGMAFPITMMGYGQHTWYLSPEVITTSLKFFYTSELLYGFTLTFTKLSLLLFFRRVFPNKSIQHGTIYVGAFIIASNISVVTAMAGQCTPVSANWTNWVYKVAPVKCINSFAVIMFFASISILHDLIILVMPLPILWGLQLNWKKKAQAMMMFSVGLFVIICSAIRLPVLLRMRHTLDPSYDQAPVALWSYLEQAVGIICGCLPAFRSLLGYLFPGLRKGALGSFDPSNNSNSKSYNSSSSRGEVSLGRSRAGTNPDPYGEGDIELGKKGTSQEQIVYIGREEGGGDINEDRASDESSIHFRLVPAHVSREKMGTTVEVQGRGNMTRSLNNGRGYGYSETQASTPRNEPRAKDVLACARKKVRVLSGGGSVDEPRREGEINVTQTVHVMQRRGRE